MNLKHFITVYKKKVCPFPVLLVAPSYSIFYRKYLNLEIGKLFVMIDDCVWDAYLDEVEFVRAKAAMLKLYRKNPKIMDEFREKFRNFSEKYLKFTKTLVNIDYSKLSDKQLYELYKKYNDGYLESFIYGESPAEFLRFAVEDDLKPKLMKLLNDEKLFNNIFSLLIIPTEESFTTTEEKDLLNIAKEINSNKELKEKLTKHAKKYAWVPVDYNGKPWTVSDFEKRLKELSEDKVDPDKKLEEINNNPKRIRERQESARKVHNIPGDIYNDCITARKCMSMMDFKKAIYSQAHLHVQYLIKEIARRLKFTITQTNYLLPDEMEAVLTDKSKRTVYTKELMDKRFKKSVYISDQLKLWFVNEKEETEIRKALYKKPEHEKELTGTCGNPGIIKAKARIINDTDDFSKFKQGEILVTAYTTPEFVIVMKKSAGIITDHGGVTSHSSIVARELNIPCVVGTKHATSLIKTGDVVEINAGEGKVKIL